jgi:hypothetical protein
LPRHARWRQCSRGNPRSGSGDDQGCINDETDAQRELSRTWFDFKPGSRSTCTQETNIGGAPSYVELLTCLQLDKQAVEAQIENKRREFVMLVGRFHRFRSDPV